MITKPQKLDALTSLRFFAAAMIVVHHGKSTFGSIHFFDVFPLDQGVSFFFVLSGFILAYNYPVLMNETDVLTFLKARIARIWPAHIAAIALIPILTAHLNTGGDSISSTAFTTVANLFLFQSLIPIRQIFFSFNAVAWSISTEMFFYFAFPLLIAKSFFDWRFKLGFLAAVVVLHIWFVAAWQIPYAYESGALKSASVDGLIYINPAVRVFEFFSGILAYWGYIRMRLHVNYSELVFTVLEVSSITLTLVVIYYSMHLPTFFSGNSSNFAKIICFYLYKSGSFWMFALLIVIFAFAKGKVTKILSLKPMVLLGEISFALYLVHITVIEWYQINAVYFEYLPQWIIVTGYWLLSLLIAYLLHKMVENPCRKLLIALPKLTVANTLKTLFAGQQGIYVALMLVILTAMSNFHRLIPCPPVLCQELAQQHPLSLPANFGGYVELTALHLSTNKAQDAEHKQLDLLFNVKQNLPNGYSVAIHLVTADGSIVSQADFPILEDRPLTKGNKWLERIKIPSTWPTQGTGLGIAFYSKSVELLTVSYPKTDYDGKRMLIDFATMTAQ